MLHLYLERVLNYRGQMISRKKIKHLLRLYEPAGDSSKGGIPLYVRTPEAWKRPAALKIAEDFQEGNFTTFAT